jgi:hypothetical protein
VESSRVRGNEPSGSIRCLEILEKLHNVLPLEYCSAPMILFSYVFTS